VRAVLRDLGIGPTVPAAAARLQPLGADDRIVLDQVDLDRVLEQMAENLAQVVGCVGRL
jgi:hypothetical protein